MGILEQILEVNKVLSEQVTSLSSEVSLVKETINNYQSNDKLMLEFSGDDILNASITAKVLGIKQTELDDIIQKGMLHSVGERKRIFLAKDVAKFMSLRDAESNHDVPVPVNKKKKKRTYEKRTFSKEQMSELVKLNTAQ